MNSDTLKRLIALPLFAVALMCSPALAQHDGHNQHEHEEAEFSQPETYSDAVHIVASQLGQIKELIADNQLDGVHKEAAIVRDVAKVMARLALKKDSGIPRKSIRDINLTAKKLAATFGPIDEAGDSGNLAQTENVYNEMVALFETLQSHLPKQYICAMGCEPGKTYDQPQACPVCGMQLVLLTNKFYSIEVESSDGQVKSGVQTTLSLHIHDPADGPVHDLKIVHEKPFHLLMVSKDLSWFAHEHPTQQPDGSLTLDFTFPHAGQFVLFSNFTPEGSSTQVVAAPLHVEGTPPTHISLEESHDLTQTIDGYTVHLETEGDLFKGHESKLAYNISRNGRPVRDIEPYLGAMGHLVLISQDLKQFVHSHPMGADHSETSSHNNSGHASKKQDHEEHGGMTSGMDSSILSYHATFPTDGLYKSWLQFQHQGKVITVPFVVHVEDGDDDHADGNSHDH